ncbi:MAG: AAA family ATPase, partial [Opitutaceae bacterium]
MYAREIEQSILQRVGDGKVLMVVGARQVGKTTFVKKLAEKTTQPLISFNGDNPADRETLSGKSLAQLSGIIGSAKTVIFDEAHKIPDIGQTLKLLVDEFGKGKTVIATGSSSIGLLDGTQEPLTGRKWVWNMFPLTPREIWGENLARSLPDGLPG